MHWVRQKQHTDNERGFVMSDCREGYETGRLYYAILPSAQTSLEMALDTIHETLRLVWSREYSADDGLEEIESLIVDLLSEKHEILKTLDTKGGL
jgi:hypothetical protein